MQIININFNFYDRYNKIKLLFINKSNLSLFLIIQINKVNVYKG